MGVECLQGWVSPCTPHSHSMVLQTSPWDGGVRLQPSCGDGDRVVFLCSLLQFKEPPSHFCCSDPVCSPWGWDHGCGILKIPDIIMNFLFHLHMPLSPSVRNSPSEPFLLFPYAACSFSLSARNPVRPLSACAALSSWKLIIAICLWAACPFILPHSIFHGCCK